ncbi:DUF1924 domain-containing protein [Thiococcus pfennigii]|uniref:DUF1924 domain-containing protein n=1 Tax=Thiococcus pfennigii TaxID=1057 RepID=UPI00190604A2|nr:DUF1924 domain-containing protein [Thiococcus pfennigii]MBK1702340.1 hypothetical protein [Thiococcus pfennigii]
MNPLNRCVLVLMAGLPIPSALAGDAAAGAAAWVAEHRPGGGAPVRSCVTCHGDDLTKPGRHAVTGKAIEPLAPSVNPERLSDPANVEKWLRRNCRWTLGRECTATEKADFVAYIKTQ